MAALKQKLPTVTREGEDTKKSFNVVMEKENKMEHADVRVIRDPLVRVRMRGLTVQSYLNAGSIVNLIDDEFCEALLKRGIKMYENTDEISFTTGKTKARGVVHVNVFLKGVKVHTTLYVVKHILHSLILGRKFLSEAGIGIKTN